MKPLKLVIVFGVAGGALPVCLSHIERKRFQLGGYGLYKHVMKNDI